ncbi:MAG TPA: FAD-dependent oxidoreductase [Chthoniobacteraceae bacterium]|nr:FAD-dependent oxidoreductase [Chthoniobacteraceae bacterium]
MDASQPSETFRPIFEECFDVAICGAGFIGFAAACRLAAEGRRVLLFEAGGDLLWESTRALENDAASPLPRPAWEAWIGDIVALSGNNGPYFEPAATEAFAARRLFSETPRIATLLYAVPVEAEQRGDALTRLTVATKSGWRCLRARQWVDATEEGLLAALCGVSGRPRLPQQRRGSLVVQASEPEPLDEAAAALPGVECLPSVRTGERRLRWNAEGEPWHRKMTAIAGELRNRLGEESDFFISHGSMREFPVYAAEAAGEIAGLPENLTLLSPAWRSEGVATLADRYELGFTGAGDLPAEPKSSFVPDESHPPVLHRVPEETVTCQVAVAGTGTAGAVAAIAAGRAGAETIAIDLAAFPGGIGTGGGITGYFHGVPGGLQDEVDLRAQQRTLLLTGKTRPLRSWHHEAKKIALLELFEESGVRFIGGAVVYRVEHDGRGRVTEVFAAGKGRIIRLAAPAFIDATGDGDLCALAGAESTLGRPGDGRFLAYSQVAFSFERGSNGLVPRAFNFDAGWVDPTDPEDLSRARLEGLALYTQWDWKGETPIVALAPTLGLRHSRLITTDAAVTLADLVAHTRFKEKIGVIKTVADTHSVDFEFESDALAFYYWTCRGFRNPLACEIPYGILLPRGLENVWIACRASGMEVDASYGFRMQREMQRLGEAAGIAATMAVAARLGSREVDLDALQRALRASGALAPDDLPSAPSSAQEWLAALDEGKPGVHLWHLRQAWESARDEVMQRLGSPDRRVSFYAAAVSALAGERVAEARLLEAIRERECGPTPEEGRVPGAFGECIDLPFWLQAVVLLRPVGGEKALPVLRDLASEKGRPFNLLTTLALTLERLAARLGPCPELAEIVAMLEPVDPSAAHLPPSRSLWRTLSGEAQKPLPNNRGLDTRQDHAWQLDLILERTRRHLGLAPLAEGGRHRCDARGFVRRMFTQRLLAAKLFT